MKKILFIHQNLQGGGAEKVLLDILNNFDYTTYDVTLLLFEGTGVYKDQVDSRVKIINLLSAREIATLGYLKKSNLWFIVNRFLRTKINKSLHDNTYDTIISFMEGVSIKCHSFIVNRAKRNISWIHIDLQLNNWCINEFKSLKEQGQIYAKMDEIIAVSDGVKCSFESLFPSLRANVIYNLINRDQIQHKSVEPNTYTPSEFTICNVGRLANQKRQDRIIKVAEIFKTNNQQVNFIIVGEGPLHEKLDKMIHEHGLENYVSILGFQKNPYPYIAKSDVFLLTSDSEGYPLVICEALCLGKPIVATDVTGPHEMLADGSGILVDKEPMKIYEALLSLYLNREILDDYSKKALSKSSMFDIDKQMLNIYRIL